MGNAICKVDLLGRDIPHGRRARFELFNNVFGCFNDGHASGEGRPAAPRGLVVGDVFGIGHDWIEA